MTSNPCSQDSNSPSSGSTTAPEWIDVDVDMDEFDIAVQLYEPRKIKPKPGVKFWIIVNEQRCIDFIKPKLKVSHASIVS